MFNDDGTGVGYILEAANDDRPNYQLLAPFTYIQLQAIKLHALRNYKRESK
jgi:hypothetical protein